MKLDISKLKEGIYPIGLNDECKLINFQEGLSDVVSVGISILALRINIRKRRIFIITDSYMDKIEVIGLYSINAVGAGGFCIMMTESPYGVEVAKMYRVTLSYRLIDKMTASGEVGVITNQFQQKNVAGIKEEPIRIGYDITNICQYVFNKYPKDFQRRTQ